MSISQGSFLYFGDNKAQRSQNVEIAQPPKGVRRGLIPRLDCLGLIEAKL